MNLPLARLRVEAVLFHEFELPSGSQLFSVLNVLDCLSAWLEAILSVLAAATFAALLALAPDLPRERTFFTCIVAGVLLCRLVSSFSRGLPSLVRAHPIDAFGDFAMAMWMLTLGADGFAERYTAVVSRPAR